MHMLTNPSVHTPRGMRRSVLKPSCDFDVWALSVNGRAAGRSDARYCKSSAPVRSPAPARTPGSGSRPKRRVMNLMIDVVSYCVWST